jgi:hypothetical protein
MMGWEKPCQICVGKWTIATLFPKWQDWSRIRRNMCKAHEEEFEKVIEEDLRRKGIEDPDKLWEIMIQESKRPTP